MSTARLLLSAALVAAPLGCGDDTSGGTGGAGGGTTTGGTETSTGTPSGATSSSSAGPGAGGAGDGGDASASQAGSTGAGEGGGSGGSTLASPGCGEAPVAGVTNETLTVDGVDRTFVLAIPAGLDGVTGVPLIFGFHGFSGTGEAASQYFGLTGEEAAIYVYPQALELPEGGVGWDMTADGVDVAFFDAMVQHFADTQCIDLERVFSAGHSHGASFSNHLGCYRPDVLRAIAPVAGGGPWAGECTGGVSAMLTHGSADEDVPIENGIASREHWLESNGCAGAASAPTDPAPCVAYEGCAEPVLWCEHGGGHEWPEGTGANIRQFFLSF